MNLNSQIQLFLLLVILLYLKVNLQFIIFVNFYHFPQNLDEKLLHCLFHQDYAISFYFSHKGQNLLKLLAIQFLESIKKLV